MSTRGFIGYKKNGIIKGWYNHNDSYYSYVGLKVLEKFNNNSSIILDNFFTKNLKLYDDEKFYENHKKVFSLNWKTDSIKLEVYNDFLDDGLDCEYGYVFNLDEDIVEVYRGGFKIEQYNGQQGYSGYYTHNTFNITRKNIENVKKIFNKIKINNNSTRYWERDFLEI